MTHKVTIPRPAQKRSSSPSVRGGIELSQDAWPVLRVAFVGAVSPAVFRDFAERLNEVIARARRDAEPLGLLVMFDAIRPEYITAATRKEIATTLRAILPGLTEVIRAEARVVHRPVLRGLITAMSWLVPFPWPAAVFETAEEGEGWLRAQLVPSPRLAP